VDPGVGKWVSYLKREKKLDSVVGRRPTAPPAPKGLYIYGNVGSGIYLLIFVFWVNYLFHSILKMVKFTLSFPLILKTTIPSLRR